MLLKKKYLDIPYPFTDPGDPIAIVYKEVLLDDGSLGLVKDYEVNLPELIDSQREDCMIENIMKRFAPGEPIFVNGNSDFVDYGDLPDNAIDFYNNFVSLKDRYNSLPTVQKAKFGNFSEFLAYITNQTATAARDEAAATDQTAENVVSEVKDNV